MTNRIFWALGQYPKCFESKEQFLAWSNTPGCNVLPCADCTKEYQTKMINKFRCENAKYPVENDE